MNQHSIMYKEQIHYENLDPKTSEAQKNQSTILRCQKADEPEFTLLRFLNMNEFSLESRQFNLKLHLTF